MSQLEVWRLWTVAAIAKFIMGMHSYRSTDFEVHRNWKAITTNLKLKNWYYEDTSVWTLDYPPFFAFFEYLLGYPASIFYPNMLVIEKNGYVSDHTIMYLRLTVIISEILMFIAIMKYTKTTSVEMMILVFLMPALIFVDHIHFQYNGFLYGIQILSLAYLKEKKYLWGAFYFAAVLNFKHIYLYQAPAYFIYLLSGYCLQHDFSIAIARLFKVGSVVIAVFSVSFGMFYGHWSQILKRLFPFKRGLCHAYWAPNVWALYQFADRVLSKGIDFSFLHYSFGKNGNELFGRGNWIFNKRTCRRL
jgi:alpha-1,3-glucosyltransferase